MPQCPACEAAIPPERWELGDILTCPECGVEVEVIGLDPLELAVAPKVEEDWGE